MPLLRRPDDHRRELRARRPTSRSAVASGRGQNRNAMTLCHDVRYRLTPPSSAPEPHFRRCFAVASVPAKAPAASSTRPKSPNQPQRQRQTRYRDRRSRRRRPRTHLQPKPPPRQIPIDGNRPPGGPRVPSWGAFGRRPPERHANSHDRPASETLHLKRISWQCQQQTASGGHRTFPCCGICARSPAPSEWGPR